jgi:hypothetical protein
MAHALIVAFLVAMAVGVLRTVVLFSLPLPAAAQDPGDGWAPQPMYWIE